MLADECTHLMQQMLGRPLEDEESLILEQVQFLASRLSLTMRQFTPQEMVLAAFMLWLHQGADTKHLLPKNKPKDVKLPPPPKVEKLHPGMQVAVSRNELESVKGVVLAPGRLGKYRVKLEGDDSPWREVAPADMVVVST